MSDFVLKTPIDLATVLEDYTGNAKVHINGTMSGIPIGKPKVKKTNIKVNSLNKETAFTDTIEPLQTCNYFELKGTSEGFKDDRFVIGTIGNDINEITLLN